MKPTIIKAFLLLAIGVALMLLAHPVADFANKDIDPLVSAQTFANVLDEKTLKTIRAIEFLQKEISRKGAKQTQYTQHEYLKTLYESQGIMVFAFRNDDLMLWSHNAISPLSAKRMAAQGREIHQFENGWYRLLYYTDGIEEYVGAIRIKRMYPYQNTFLNNAFAGDFALDGLTAIQTKSQKGAVKLRADHQYFYLLFEDENQRKRHNPTVFILLSAVGGMLIFLGLLRFALLHVPRLFRPFSFFFFAVTALLLRWWSITSGWPGYISALDWFSPSVYASSLLFPSIADFLINVLLIALLAAVIRFRFFNRAASSALFQITATLPALGVFALSLYVNYLLKGLVINSNIPFEINIVTNLNAYSLAGLCGSALAYFTVFLLADTAVLYAKNKKIAPHITLIGFLLLSIVHIFVAHILGIRDMIFVLWPVLLISLLIYLRLFANKTKLNLGFTVLVIVLYAGVAAYSFIKYSNIRERNQRSILVERQILNEDPVAELLYSELSQELARDRDVRRVFEENELHSRQTLEGYIIPRYFTGYWGNYDVEIYAYLADSTIWGKLPPVRPPSFQEFLKTATFQGEPTTADSSLVKLYNRRDVTRYMGIIPLHYNLQKEPDGHFVVVISAKQFGQQSGFPALLVDGKTGSMLRKSDNYSTAKYVNGQLRSKNGDFIYRSTASDFTSLEHYPTFIQKNNFEHLVSLVDDDTVIVVSKPLNSLLDKATVVSYLCALFGLLFALARIIHRRVTLQQGLALNLNQKVQVLLILLTLTSMILVAWATMFYIEENYSKKNRGLVTEKMQSILREVQDQLNEEEEITYNMGDHINRLLSQLSFVFYTDIHLFSPEGELLGSSQMRMFNEGLLSRQINPTAYANLSFVSFTEFLHEEAIGELDYISAYTPFYNKQGVLLGYLNLPYFARQAELEQEIASFLETVINIFVLLFIISILIGLFISQWITAPLRVIRESLSAVELGKANRILGYAGNDEIGLLVSEYNAKVAELENNAEKLAQGERESAWREMAKQVAHEIKNPLTPMKLNVQYLQRTLARGEAPGEEQVNRLTSSLIEQIDALTEIANAFSNFAKMPGTKRDPVNLVEIIANTATLYSSFDNIKLRIELNGLTQAMVRADKEQLIRVFNNLIKNAIQAIAEGDKGEIGVTLHEAEDGYQASVRDNGTGVGEALKSKIFMPNFTTKSRGMGLGLAMSKNIVENSMGRIWYESQAGKGSTFYVWLPRL